MLSIPENTITFYAFILLLLIYSAVSQHQMHVTHNTKAFACDFMYINDTHTWATSRYVHSYCFYKDLIC